MTFKYSATTGNFYPDELDYPNLPDDVIEVTYDDYAAAMSRSLGDTLAVQNGQLVIIPLSVTAALNLAKELKLAELENLYRSAIAEPVTYKSKLFQSDETSITNLERMLVAFNASNLPANFIWISQDNSPVPFTYADMQALAVLIGTQAFNAFLHLQTLKAAVRAAGDLGAVQSVVW